MCQSELGRPDSADSEVLSETVEYWRARCDDVEVAMSRVLTRLRGRDQRILLLERALARTATLHHALEDSLEQRLEQCSRQLERAAEQHISAQAPPARTDCGVVVRLPHLSRTLSILFEVMWEHWAQWEPERPPKSSTVARAIDAKLGLKGQADGEASRNGQTFAAALRPDSISDSDGRHR
ncbi:MAG: hypothetical protein OSB38_24705 [Paraburkholderia fungorum]|nr:hypothetical protein [Paraburkholderia fungorum]